MDGWLPIIGGGSRLHNGRGPLAIHRRVKQNKNNNGRDDDEANDRKEDNDGGQETIPITEEEIIGAPDEDEASPLAPGDAETENAEEQTEEEVDIDEEEANEKLTNKEEGNGGGDDDDEENERDQVREDDDLKEEDEPQTDDNGEDSSSKTQIDLVKLIPFDVKLSLLASEALNTFVLTDIVTDWLDESLTAQVKRMELGLTHSEFDSVILEERALQPSSSLESDNNDNRQRYLRGRKLQNDITTMIASYEGVSLWKHTTPSSLERMTPEILEDLERQALLQDDILLDKLQSSNAQGLGDSVVDVRAYINPNPKFSATTIAEPTNSGGLSNANLELIIVVAIVVACMAFAFLVFSLFWAWRFDRQRRDAAYRVDASAVPNQSTDKLKGKSPAGSGGTDPSEFGEDDSKLAPSNVDAMINRPDDPTELDYPGSETNLTSGNYPESVISEDISTSLSAYYRSGMGSRPIYGSEALGNADFNDQASFSSMESYGYSLDGYAPSLGGNTYSKNATASGTAENEPGNEDR